MKIVNGFAVGKFKWWKQCFKREKHCAHVRIADLCTRSYSQDVNIAQYERLLVTYLYLNFKSIVESLLSGHHLDCTLIYGWLNVVSVCDWDLDQMSTYRRCTLTWRFNCGFFLVSANACTRCGLNVFFDINFRLIFGDLHHTLVKQ